MLTTLSDQFKKIKRLADKKNSHWSISSLSKEWPLCHHVFSRATGGWCWVCWASFIWFFEKIVQYSFPFSLHRYLHHLLCINGLKHCQIPNLVLKVPCLLINDTIHEINDFFHLCIQYLNTENWFHVFWMLSTFTLLSYVYFLLTKITR